MPAAVLGSHHNFAEIIDVGRVSQSPTGPLSGKHIGNDIIVVLCHSVCTGVCENLPNFTGVIAICSGTCVPAVQGDHFKFQLFRRYLRGTNRQARLSILPMM
jgi:hypothetical protein